MDQAPIFFNGIQISEPVTALTAFMVSAAGFYAWWQSRKWGEKDAFLRNMQYYFLLMGISTLMGGLFAHALLHFNGHVQKVPGWLVGMVGMYFIEQASIYRAKETEVIKSKTAISLKNFSIGKLILLLLVTISTQHLNWVGIQTLTALYLVVLPLHWQMYKQLGNAIDKYFLQALALSVPIFIVSAFKLSFHAYFDFNDISHVIMVGCILLFLKGCHSLMSAMTAKSPILQ